MADLYDMAVSGRRDFRNMYREKRKAYKYLRDATINLVESLVFSQPYNGDEDDDELIEALAKNCHPHVRDCVRKAVVEILAHSHHDRLTDLLNERATKSPTQDKE